MSSRFILCEFDLWVDYSQIMFRSVNYGDQGIGSVPINKPKLPTQRKWKRALGRFAVFYFARQISNSEVNRRINNAGFMNTDVWCLHSLLEIHENLPVCFDLRPIGIVATNTKVFLNGGFESPFINEVNKKIFIDFVQRRSEDWSGYWLPHWKFLAVKWYKDTTPGSCSCVYI